MTTLRTEKIWKNGKLIAWENATIHVMSHAVHYGTSWFEGVRCYKTERGAEVFRLSDHVHRLFNSCKIYRTDIPFTENEIAQGILETIRVNKLESCYIRPLVFRGFGSLGVNPLKAPVDTYLMVWEWGSYLGEEALADGVDVCTSSWQRAAPNTFPSIAKAGGNYLNSGLIKMEAAVNGFAEGIALDVHGHLSEGSGENLFLIQDGKVYTPSLSSSILGGITRSSVLTLLRERNVEVIEKTLPREMLYTADEIFFTGTAAEVTPIRSVDRIQVGTAGRGPITEQVQSDFFDYVYGRVDDRHDWMTPVHAPSASTTPVG